MIDFVLLSGLLAAGLAAVHLFSGRLRFLSVLPRSRWLSAAGGVSVAYVFVHLLPDLAEEQVTIRRAAGGSFLRGGRHRRALGGVEGMPSRPARASRVRIEKHRGRDPHRWLLDRLWRAK